MSTLAITAAIIGAFFTAGIGVGVLIVIAIPGAGRARLGGSQRPGSGPADQPGLSSPQWPAQAQPEDPDDRDEYPWWPSAR